MNLLLRLFLTFLLSPRRGHLHVLDTCVTPFRVWPNDLDVLRHMTNGRYFTILDLARVDLMIRSRVWPQIKRQGWYPVVTLETMRFHRSLELWDRYDVATRVIGWDERHVFLDQAFIRDGVQVALVHAGAHDGQHLVLVQVPGRQRDAQRQLVGADVQHALQLLPALVALV